MSRAEPSAVDAARFRHVLGHLPTGVTVITAMAQGRPVGMACNSFTSVSLEPPLVSFCAGRHSDTWPGIRDAGRFAVNVLASGQLDLGRRFARKGVDRFAGTEWRLSPLGSPYLTDAAAWVDCELHAEYEAGDHWIALGLVNQLEAAGEAKPLVFFRGGFGSFSRV